MSRRSLMRSVIAIVLAVVLACGTCASAFATRVDKPKLNYVSLGESMATGFGYDDYYVDDYDGQTRGENGHKNVRGFLVEAEEAYPTQLAALLGDVYDVNLTQLAGNAMRIDDIYANLCADKSDYAEDDFFNRVFNDTGDNNSIDESGEEWFLVWGERAQKLKKSGEAMAEDALRDAYQTAVAEADLITLSAGYNNFGTFLVGRLTQFIGSDFGVLPTYGARDDDTLQDLLNAIDCDLDVEETKATVLAELDKATGVDLSLYDEVEFGGMTIKVGDFVDLLLYAYVSYCYYFNQTVNRIYELNEDVELVVVSMYNSQDGLTFTYGDKIFDLGAAYGALVDLANTYTGIFCEKADTYKFVDLTADGIVVESLYDELAVKAEDKALYHRLVESINALGIPVGAEQAKALGVPAGNYPLIAILNAVLAKASSLSGANITVPATIIDDTVKAAFDAVIDAGTFNSSRQLFLNQQFQILIGTALAGGDVSAAALNLAMEKGAELGKGEVTANETIVAVYSIFVDLFSAAAKVENIDVQGTLAALAGGGLDLAGALGGQNAALNGVLNLYVRMVLCNGMMMHPSVNGHATIAAEIVKVLADENAPSARQYNVAKLLKAAEPYVPVVADAAFRIIKDELAEVDSTYSISKQAIFVAQNMHAVVADPALTEADDPRLVASVATLKAAVAVLNEATEGAFADTLAVVDDALDCNDVATAVNTLKQALMELNNTAMVVTAAIEEAVAKVEAAINAVVDTVEAIEAELNGAHETAKAKLAQVKEEIAKVDKALYAKAVAIDNKLYATHEELKAAHNEVVAELRAVDAELAAAYEAALAEVYSTEAKVTAFHDVTVAAIYAQIDALNAQIEQFKPILSLLYLTSTNALYEVDEDSYYVSIGDSLMTGMGLGGDINDGWNYGYGKSVAEAYPQVLADMIGLDETQHVTLGMGGVRVEDLRCILDLDAETDDCFNRYTVGNLASFGEGTYGATREAVHNTFVKELSKADLITVSMGGNNFGNYPGIQMTSIMATGEPAYEIDFSKYLDDELLTVVTNAIQEFKTGALKTLMAKGVAIDPEVAESLDKAILVGEAFLDAYLGFSYNYAETLNTIHSINPEALVVVVGLYNTVDDLTFEVGDVCIDVGAFVDQLLQIVNTQFLIYAMSTANTIYVDVPDVTMFADEDENRASTNLADGEYIAYMSSDRGLPSHPNAEGHAYMAQQIYDALFLTYRVTGVELNKTATALKVGQTETLTATVSPANAYYPAVVWESSNPTVVEVDQNGKLTAKAAGTAVITVTTLDGGKVATCDVTVTAYAPYYPPVEEEKEETKLFEDVTDPDTWYFDAVYWAVEHGITDGTSATTFSPVDGCTRAQMVTFLWRIENCPEPKNTTCQFTDLNASAYYYKAVLWAVENGITNGTSEYTFSPDVTVTRAQTVTFLYRYLGTKVADVKSVFEDVDSNDYFYDAVQWAAENGVTNGTSATTFSPDDICTRAQIVTFLYRLLKDVLK